MGRTPAFAALWWARSEEYQVIAESCRTEDGRASFLALAQRCNEHALFFEQMARHDRPANGSAVANTGIASSAMTPRSAASHHTFVRAMRNRIDYIRRRSSTAPAAPTRLLHRLVEEMVREFEDTELAIMDTWIARWVAEARSRVNSAQLNEALHAIAFALFPPKCRPRLPGRG
jgi:hypothetical protein